MTSSPTRSASEGLRAISIATFGAPRLRFGLVFHPGRKPMPRIVFVFAVLTLPCPPSADAQPAPTETVIRLKVKPAPAPKPSLKYQLLPELREINPGNAVQGYMKCFAEQNSFFFSKEAIDEREKLQEMPLKD